MAAEMDVIEQLSDLLACGNTKSVKSIMNEDTFDTVLQERANDLIHIAAYYINNKSLEENPAVFRCSEKLIVKCAAKGNPKECLMEFLAQIESLDQLKFQILLIPIQTSILRIPDRKSPLMQCVFNVIYGFINSLPLPQCDYLDNSSKLLLDCDENIQRITDIYQLLVTFYEPFINEITFTGDKRINSIKRVLLQALFHLLGNPLVFIDLEFNEKGESALRVYASKIIKFILKLQVDPFQLLTLVESKDLVTVEEEKCLVDEFSSNELKFSYVSLAVFFYLILSERMCSAVPCVYNKHFIFQNGLSLATTLLKYKESLVFKKGILLTKVFLDSIEPNSVTFQYLSPDIHKEVIIQLSNIAVYHDDKENRKLSAELIKQHFSTFKPKAQFYLLLNSNSIVQNPNMLGLFTTFLTNTVRNSFSDEELKEYFTGKRLFDLLHIFCSLKKGAETDLIENKDHILSALNLIIFITKRDVKNFTGIWNFIDNISQNFLSPLRKAVDLSRAHFNLQLNTLEDPSQHEDRVEFAVTVGGQELDRMSIDEKKCVISSGLVVFDLIEHLLSRANECIENMPFAL